MKMKSTDKIIHELFCVNCGKTRNMRISQHREIIDTLTGLKKTKKQYNCRVCGNFIKVE